MATKETSRKQSKITTIDINHLFQYPDCEQKHQFSTLVHDTIKDPFNWLENLNDEQTKNYIKAENTFTSNILAKFNSQNNHNKFEKILKKYYEMDKYRLPIPVAGIYYQFSNFGTLYHDVLIKKNKLDDDSSEIVFDFNNDESKRFEIIDYKFSHNGKYIACIIIKNDYTQIIRTIELNNPQNIEDIEVFDTMITWSMNDKGFYYSKFVHENQHGIYHHNVKNKNSNEDVLCMYIETNPIEKHRFKADMTNDGKYLIIYQTSTYYGNLFYFIRQHRNYVKHFTEVVQVVYKWGRYYKYVQNDKNHIVFLTNRRASNRKLIMMNFHNKKPKCHTDWYDVVPESPTHVIENAIGVAKNKIIVQYRLRIDYEYIYRHANKRPNKIVNDLNGPEHDYLAVYVLRQIKCEQLYLIEIPLKTGYISKMIGNNDSNEIFFKVESYLNPGTICTFTINEDDIKPKYKICTEPKYDLDFVIPDLKVGKYKSYDSKIIYVGLFRSLKSVMPCRCLLTAYGGFNQVMRYYYNPYILAFCEAFKGTVVIAHIRGDGELGDKWHRSGMRHKKMRVIRDFIYVSNGLIREGVTTRRQLAIRGFHHGGFLVAASANLSPKIAKASIIENGVLDLIAIPRHNLFSQQLYTEFGYPHNPLYGLNFWYTISPAHNVSSPISYSDYFYPATFVVSTANSYKYIQKFHTLKYIANLQDELTYCNLGYTPMLCKIDEIPDIETKLRTLIDEFIFIDEMLD